MIHFCRCRLLSILEICCLDGLAVTGSSENRVRVGLSVCAYWRIRLCPAWVFSDGVRLVGIGGLDKVLHACFELESMHWSCCCFVSLAMSCNYSISMQSIYEL